jgi:hypothetical protein
VASFAAENAGLGVCESEHISNFGYLHRSLAHGFRLYSEIVRGFIVAYCVGRKGAATHARRALLDIVSARGKSGYLVARQVSLFVRIESYPQNFGPYFDKV